LSRLSGCGVTRLPEFTSNECEPQYACCTLGIAGLSFMGLRSTASILGWQSLIHLGGPGLVLLGIIDQSFVPIPGGMDAITIVLAAGHRNLWLYYAFMATVGTVLGAFLTYSLSKKGGKAALENKLPRKKIKKVESKFSQHGFSAVFIPCLLPPPLPAVPFLVGAGALQYPRKKFLFAVALGRAIRYTIVAYLGHRYGDPIIGFFKQYATVIIIVFAVLMIGATLGGWLLRKWQKKKEAEEERRTGKKPEPGREEEQHPDLQPVPDPGLQRTAPLSPVEYDQAGRRKIG
jgi:membrane protein DedA with SNARE-associated domain